MKKILIFICIIVGCAFSQESQNDNSFSYYPFGTDVVFKHFAYAFSYNEYHEQANWVAYKLTKEQALLKIVERTDNFRSDPIIPFGSATPNDYKGTKYDRGHLVPANDMTWSEQAMAESFFMSNMSPQNPQFNRGIWRSLEALVHTWAIQEDEIYIITGPILQSVIDSIGENRVSVPMFYFKIILDLKPTIKGIGFILPNKGSNLKLQSFAISIDTIERLSCLDFFPALPDSIETIIESQIHFDQWLWEKK